jgi:Glycosyltransferases involved in cell wall biogenesis
MEKGILLTIICITYNQGQYIEKTIQNFLSQKTNFEYEIIIHDDASSDETVSILKKYKCAYPNKINLILQHENQYSKSVNFIEKFMEPLIRGKYVAFCEGDDYWCDENKLQDQVDFLEKNPNYIACAHQTIVKNIKAGTEKTINFLNHDQDITFKSQLYQVFGKAHIHSNSLVYRRFILDKKPKFVSETRSFGDYQLLMYISLLGNIRFINKIMSVYNLFSTGSWTENSKKEESQLRIFKERISLLLEVNRCTRYKYFNDIIYVIIKFHLRPFIALYLKVRHPLGYKVLKRILAVF